MNGKLIALFHLALAQLLLAACAPSIAPISASEANAALGDEFVLAVGDTVRITVFDEPNLTGEYEVSSNGSVAFPLIGEIEARGKSPSALASSIRSALAQGEYVLNPRVSAEVLTYRSIYVLGEVREPGEYEFTGDISALQAVAKAGGFSPMANRKEIVLRRVGWDGERLVKIADTSLRIAPGDTIIVRESLF